MYILTYRIQAKREIIEATPEEKIERLETAKARLMTRRTELEKKIEGLRKKQRESDGTA